MDVTNASVVTAIADDPAAVREAANVSPRAVVSSQAICAKRVADWVFGGGSPSARPLLVAVVGDSYATGLSLPANCAVNGSWNLGLNSPTGGATETNQNWTNWINGHTFTFPVGSQADITSGGQSGNGGYCEGDTVGIAYIKEPGAGTFALQAYSSVSGSWSTIATIDTSNASKIGAYQEIALSTTNNPHYKLRVTSVTGGTVNIVAFGIWNKLAGGAMLFPYGALQGQSPTQVNSTSSAIFNPIWQGLKPDLVLACFQDGASEWVSEEVGGSFTPRRRRSIRRTGCWSVRTRVTIQTTRTSTIRLTIQPRSKRQSLNKLIGQERKARHGLMLTAFSEATRKPWRRVTC